MDFYKVPIGFGMALAQNTAAMNRYAGLSEAQKQTILNKAHNVRSERGMHALVASLAGGTMGGRKGTAAKLMFCNSPFFV